MPEGRRDGMTKRGSDEVCWITGVTLKEASLSLFAPSLSFTIQEHLPHIIHFPPPTPTHRPPTPPPSVRVPAAAWWHRTSARQRSGVSQTFSQGGRE